ncbi:MAG: hypothetical protein H6741_35200 [Alphaproteobacteria bacterium]|nr:hypothetical protein [Alphaproteobacteria bacterium]
MLIGILMPSPESTPAQAGLLPVSLLSIDDMLDTCETEPDHLEECVIEPS